MPDEALIKEMENIFAEVVELGGQSENTKIVPNMLITNDSPGGLTGFVTIQDDRDGDNILAKTVPGIIYATNDLVNVIFPKGGEAIAFQQGSQSASSSLWATVPATSTDIFYNQGDVGIGKAVAPDAALEILDTAQAQLRLTFQEDTKFADLTVDTNHDLTIKPSSTGQIILQPTTDQTDSVQILDADGGTPVFNADLVNERIGIGTATPAAKLVVFDSGANIPTIFINDGDISTPFTTVGTPDNDANTVLRLGGASSGDGGGFVSGFSDATAGAASIGLWLAGYLGAASPIAPAVFIDAYKTDGGTEAQAIAAGEIAFQVATAFSTKLMTILGNGDLGIQNVAPTTPLSTGFSNIGLTVGDGSATAGIVLYSATSSTLSSLRFGDAGGGNYDQGFVLYDHNNDKLLLGANRGTAITIDSSQRVGLNGITSPSTELDIGAGAIEKEEMTAPGAGAANTTRQYAEDDTGTTREQIIFNGGHVVTIARDGGLQTYTPTNVVTDRSYDANATSVAELADVLGTLIADFQAAGVLG